MHAIILLCLSYLIGSISPSILICKLLNLKDPRTVGSKNAGATNMLRNSNIKIALIVLLLDLLKGTLIIVIAKHFFPLNINLILSSALFVILGHTNSIFFGFKGGKGVATYLGLILVISPISGFAFIVTWILTVLITRYASLGSLIATVISSIMIYFSTNSLIVFIIIILIVFKHKQNIVRLLKRQEHKLLLSRHM